MLGIENFHREEAIEMLGNDPNFSHRDLFEAIKKGDSPQWRVCVQIMDDDQAAAFPYNRFDLTKVWPHKQFPLQEVGIITLNRNPQNYFAEVEQAAFAPANIVPGMGYSPDKMLEVRILYGFDGPVESPHFRDFSWGLQGSIVDRYNHHRGNDDFSQAGDLFRLLAPDAQQRLIHNIVMSMKGVSREIQARQIRHFLKADVRYGRGVMECLCCDPKAVREVEEPEGLLK